jgi:hypothetical protein
MWHKSENSCDKYLRSDFISGIRQKRPDQQGKLPDQGGPRLAVDATFPRASQPVMTMRLRIEVNLEKLDPVIDRGTRTG